MNVYVRLTYRNLRANLDPISLFFEFIFPIFFIFGQGPALSGSVAPIAIGGGKFISYALFLAAGAVTLTVINSGTNAGTQLWYDRKNGMFEQVLMGPFTRAEYLLSIVFATLLIGIVSSLLVFGLALPVLGGSLSMGLAGIALTGVSLFFGTLFFGGLALALSVALRSSETFQIVSQFAFFIFLFTSTIFFPSNNAPEAIKVISLLNPLTYATDVFRAGLFGSYTSFVSIEMAALAIEAVVMFSVAVVSFRRIRV